MPSELLVLSTPRRAAEELDARVRAAGRALVTRDVLTLGALETALVEEVSDGGTVLSPLAESVLAAGVAAALGGSLPRGLAGGPGVFVALRRAMALCDEAGLDAAAVDDAASRASGVAAARLGLAAAALAERARLAASRGLVTRAQALWEVARRLRRERRLPAQLADRRVIVVREPLALPPVRLAWLEGLATACAARGGELVLELAHHEHPIWGRATGRTLARLEAAGEHAAIAVRPIDPLDAARGVGRRVAAALADGERAGEPGAPLSGALVLSAAGRAEERRLVAETLRTWIADGLAPAHLGLALAGPAAEHEAWWEALERAGVPVTPLRRLSARCAPSVRWVLGALEAHRRGWPRDELAALLASEFARRLFGPAGSEGRPLALDAARAVHSLGVRPDPERAEPPVFHLLDGARDGVRGRAASAARALSAFTARAVDATTLGGQLAEIGAFAEAMALSHAASVRERPAEELRELVAFESDALAELEARAFGRDRLGFESLRAALHALGEASSLVGDLVPPAFSVTERLLEEALDAEAIPTGRGRGGGVLVGAPAELVGLPLDGLVLASLEDGVFPRRAPRGDLLGPDERAALADAALRRTGPPGAGARPAVAVLGPEWIAGDDDVDVATYFRLACAPHRRLAWSRPRADGDGAELLPSRALDEALAALGRAGWRLDEVVEPKRPYSSLDAAAGVDAVRRAVVRRIAAVAPGVTVADAYREPVPRADGGAEAALADAALLGRVHVERARLAAIAGAQIGAHARYAGEVGAPCALATPERPLAVTALEHAAACPFRFFLVELVGLRAAPAGSDDPDGRERGRLAHSVLAAAVEALRAEGLSRLGPGDAERARAVVDAAAREEVARELARAELDPVLAAPLAVELGARVGRLVEVLAVEDSRLELVGAELAFGPAGRWPTLRVRVPGREDVGLQGRLDLVEVGPSGARVSDLKSAGSADVLLRDVRGEALGRQRLQLFAYGAALVEAEVAVRVDARFLSLADGAPSRGLREVLAEPARTTRVAHDPDEWLRVARPDGAPTALAERIHALVAPLRRGEFPVAPAEGACVRCDFRAVCRLPREGAEAADEEAS